MLAHTHEHAQTQIMHVMLTKVCKSTSFEIETTAMHSPHDAMTGNSGCLAMDLILPEHFPKKHPTNFPVRKQCINKKKKRYKESKIIKYRITGPSMHPNNPHTCAHIYRSKITRSIPYIDCIAIHICCYSFDRGLAEIN